MSENIALEEKEKIINKKNDEPEDDDVVEREEWGNKLDFLLSCVGYAVGFGNVWRFPNLCYENGGGAFLIPYFIFLAICGMPLFFMELALSQYIGLAPIGCWKAISPLLQGIGYSMLIISFLVCVYYNTIIAWVFYYLFESFRSDVPWRDCNNEWNNKKVCYAGPPGDGKINKTVFDRLTNTTFHGICAEQFNPYYGPIGAYAGNATMSNSTNATEQFLHTTMSTLVSNSTNNTQRFLVNCTYNNPEPVLPAQEFLNNYILNQSNGIHEPGEIKWELALCLLFAWIFVYFCIWKGVKSVGKVVYVTATFPYLVLFILLIRGVTLPGAGKGIRYYLEPDFKMLVQPQVWVRAASQIFYSLGIGFGSLIAMGSYNKFNNNCYRDAVMVSLINCGTSVFCGFVVFSVLGHLSEVLNLDISKVAEAGPGLVFVVYPSGIASMPVSTLWAILFFLMLLTLGLDSQFAMMECVISSLSDEYPKYLRKYKEVFIMVMCIFAFLLGLPTVTQAGSYVVEMFNTQAGGVSLLFLAFFESVAIGWVYGADRLLENIETMIGYKPHKWWAICWKYISPLLILITFIYGVTQWKGIKFGKNYVYPGWAEGLGWMLALVSMICIPIGMIYVVYTASRTRNSFSPNDTKKDWRTIWHEVSVPDEAALKKIEYSRIASPTEQLVA